MTVRQDSDINSRRLIPNGGRGSIDLQADFEEIIAQNCSRRGGFPQHGSFRAEQIQRHRLIGADERIAEYTHFDPLLDFAWQEYEQAALGQKVTTGLERRSIRCLISDEDFVIFRSDGNPVFHFVNVVDDIAMQITHVIRGEDHLSNTSKHVELFKAFGVTPPHFAHIPLILKSDGPGKMSKRDRGALIDEYQKRGYLPEAVVNFLCLLGWNPGDDREKMPIAEIVKLFDLPGVNQSNARFDEKKMAHMNMLYLLEQPADRFVALAHAHLQQQNATAALAAEPAFFREVMLLSQPKIKGLEELPAYTAYFFSEDFAIDEKVKAKVMAKGDPKARLRELIELLRTADFGSDAALETAIKDLATKGGLGFGDYQSVARLAVSGTNVGPSITGMFRVLGRERVLARMERFLAAA